MKYCTSCNKHYQKYADKCPTCNLELVEVPYQEIIKDGVDEQMYSGNMQNGNIRNEFMKPKKNKVASVLKFFSIFAAMISVGTSGMMAWRESRDANYDPLTSKLLGYSADWDEFVYFFVVNITNFILMCGIMFALAEMINLLQKLVNKSETQ